MTELNRHKEALQVAIGALRELGLDYAHFTDRVEKRIAAILESPQEMETVEVVRWMMKDDPSTIHNHPHFHVDNYVKLTGTIQRPVKMPVVREVSVEVSWERHQGVRALPLLTDTNADFEWESLLGKTGTLIFRYTE